MHHVVNQTTQTLNIRCSLLGNSNHIALDLDHPAMFKFDRIHLEEINDKCLTFIFQDYEGYGVSISKPSTGKDQNKVPNAYIKISTTFNLKIAETLKYSNFMAAELVTSILSNGRIEVRLKVMLDDTADHIISAAEPCVKIGRVNGETINNYLPIKERPYFKALYVKQVEGQKAITERNELAEENARLRSQLESNNKTNSGNLVLNKIETGLVAIHRNGRLMSVTIADELTGEPVVRVF